MYISVSLYIQFVKDIHIKEKQPQRKAPGEYGVGALINFLAHDTVTLSASRLVAFLISSIRSKLPLQLGDWGLKLPRSH